MATCLTIVCLLMASCSVPKQTYFFKNLQRDTSLNSIGRGEDLRIKKNDLLLINFSSLNPAEDAVYNTPGMVGGGSLTSSTGYQVDGAGNIQLHKLGVTAVEGMTRADLKNKLQKDISPFLKDPVVTVRFQNHKITVLGDVGSSQVIDMPEEKLPLLEVLGKSGDITEYGRMDNVLVIRDKDNGKDFKRINLEDHSIFNSPYYWLQPGDMVYVEPNDKRNRDEQRVRLLQNVSLGVTALSVGVLILSLINR